MNLLSLRNITKDYINEEIVTQVLRGVSIDIAQGEFVSIMGPSGSGKSTLMHIMGFLDRPTAGEFLFRGEKLQDLTDDELAVIRNENIGFVFQQFFLLPKTSVFDNVKLPLWYSAKPHSDQDVTDAIASVGLTPRTQNLSNQLSGGEKQRVAIARALVNKPSIIFADEPTGNLDSKSGNQVMSILQHLNEQGVTIILVTHEMDTAKHGKRLVRVRDGMIESDAPILDRVFATDGELKK